MSRRIAVAALLAASLLSPAAASAEEPAGPAAAAPAAQDVSLGRTVAGHTFIPSLVVQDPFVATEFAMGIVGGYGSSTGPKYDLNGNIVGEQDYIFGSFGNYVGARFKVLDWLAVRGSLSVTAYSGLDGASAVTVGANARVGGTAGAIASFPVGKSLRVAGSFDAAYTPKFDLLLITVIKDTINSCNGDPASCTINPDTAFRQDNVLTLQPAVSAAWTPWKPLGIVASASYQHLSLDTKQQGKLTQQGATLGVAADLDLRHLVGVPVGFNLAWHWVSPVGGAGVSRTTDYVAGVFYTGREDLALGVEAGARVFHIRPDLQSTAGIGQLSMRYYW